MSDCPPEDLVSALLDGRLAGDEAARLRRHIDTCSSCLTLFGALAHEARTPAFPPTEPVAAEAETASPLSIHDWTPPRAFDGFNLLRLLGRGGMGRVYLAHEEALDRHVAIKFVASARPDEAALARFYVEARAIARLQHPNVVAIFRIGEVLGRPYLAYEYIAGPSLDRLERPLPWPRALNVALGLARGLAAAHQRDVLHRDIKPANAILAQSGEVKLLDFGLAKLVHEPLPPEQVIDPLGFAAAGLTVTGALLGTPLYLAPERWAGRPATTRSDIYSMGLVLYELCAGRVPHSGLPIVEMAGRVQTGDAPPIRAACPAIPAAFAEVIDRCVARRPEDRFANADEVRDALEGVDAFCRTFRLIGGEAAPASDGVVQRVTESFARVAPRADQLVIRLYERLFAERPALRALFPADLGGQRMKLATALKTIVDDLGAPERLIPMLEDLGRRHAPYGVEPDDFDVLGKALIGAIGEVEGPAWTPTLEAAWGSAFERTAAAMRRGLAAARAAAQRISQPPFEAQPPPSEEPPETRYTTSGEVTLAYQVFGHGPIDLVVVPSWVTHLEAAWACLPYARFLRGLAASARVIVFDGRGTGLSERSRPSSVEERIEDLRAVLDAAGAGRAVICGPSTGSLLALLFAARHPERTRALVTIGGTARAHAAPGYPCGHDPARLAPVYEQIQRGWGGPLFLAELAPSAVDDDALRRSWAAYLRTGASPAVAAALLRADFALDVRAELAAIEAPALVLHRRGDRILPAAGSRYLAARLRNGRYVELPGADHLPFAGDAAAVLAELRGFLTALEEAEISGVVTTLPHHRVDRPGRARG